MPLPRLQTISDESVTFLYAINWTQSVRQPDVRRYQRGEGGPFDNRIHLRPGVGEALVRLNHLLRPLIHHQWAVKVAMLKACVSPAVRSCSGTTPSGVAAREQRLQMLHVVQVLVPARDALVLQEIGETDHGQGYARPVGSLQALVHPVRPGLFERDAIDCADQVDSMRRSAELDDHLRLQWLALRRNAGDAAVPELAQRREEMGCVVSGLLVPEVHVTRQPWVW